MDWAQSGQWYVTLGDVTYDNAAMISRSISLSASSFMLMLQRLVLKSNRLWVYVFFLSNVFVYISKRAVANRIYERVIHEAKRWPALVVPQERDMPQDVWHIIVQQVFSASFNTGGQFFWQLLETTFWKTTTFLACHRLLFSCCQSAASCRHCSGQPVVSSSDSEHVRFEG